jgi:ABC-type dipeptide/oligopeptide/nickel transport system permease component
LKLYLYIIRRIIHMLLIMFGGSLLIFFLMRGISPHIFWLDGYLNPFQTAAQRLQTAQSLGLATNSCPSFAAWIGGHDNCVIPWWQQYFSWIENVVLGTSGGGGNEWAPFIYEMPYTIELLAISLAISTLVAIMLAAATAIRRNSLFDALTRPSAIGISSAPSFAVALFLMLYFAEVYIGKLGPLFPLSGRAIWECAVCYPNIGFINTYTGFPLIDSLLSGNFPYFWDMLLSLVLPITTLVLLFLAPLFRHARSALLQALNQDYVQFARSKGIRERTIIYRHALRNSASPIITVTTMLVPIMLTNVVVVEYVFGLQGISQLILQAINNFNPVLSTDIALVMMFLVVIINLAVDIAYGVIDPRVRVG